MKKLMLLFALVCAGITSNGQQLTNEGTEFYLAFPETYDNAAAQYELTISSRVAGSGVVEIPGLFWSVNFNVVPGVVTTVQIPSAMADITSNQIVADVAIHVTATVPITVYASTFHLYRSEATVCLPVSSFASEYMVTTHETVLKGGIWYQSEFIVVAGNQPCDITIIPSDVTEAGSPAGVPISVHLDPNDIYQVQAQTGSNTDLTGSLVFADNGTDEFAVYNGHIWLWLGTCGNQNADPVFEQCYPLQSWGVEYIIPITEEQNENYYRVVAAEDNTTFTVDGTPTGPVLMSGDVYEGSFTDVEECIMIQSNNPIAVTQAMTTGVCSGDGDPSMVIINSNEQMYLDTVTFNAVDYNGLDANYLNIVTRTTDIGTVNLDLAPVGGWLPVPHDGQYSYVIMPIDTGSHTLTTTGCGFLAYTYGLQYAESYFYAAGARVNSVDDSLSFTNINTSQQGLCDLDSIQFTPFTSGGQVINYYWDFGDGDTAMVQEPIHTYANQGTYTVTLIVEYQCFTDTITDDVTVFDSPSISGSHTDVTCWQYGDGTINTTVTDGTPGYTYTWSPNVGTTGDLTGLDGGTYTVIVTDQNGCNDGMTFDVLEPGPIDIDLVPAGPYAPPDGPQNLSATPGGGIWTCPTCPPGGITPTGVFDPAATGPGLWEVCYTVTVGPCDSTECMMVLVDTSCAMLAFTNEPTCYGFNDGSFTVNVSGGTGPITFTLTDDQGTQVNSGNSNTANNLNSGWYYINVVDDVCLFNDSVFIDQPDEMQVTLDLTHVLCNGDETGMAIADTVTGWQGLYSDVAYFWNPAPPSGNGQGADTLSGIGAGTYNLQINDGNGCAIQVDFTITEPTALSFTQFGSEPAYCRLFDYQNGNGVVYAAATGGTPGYTYEWKNAATQQTSPNSTWGGLNPGVYTITITDNNGCILQDFIIMDSLSPIADFDVTSPQFLDFPLLEGTAIVNAHFVNQSQYFANPNNPQADTTFFWDFDLGEGWILSESYYEEFDRSYADSGTYSICLIALNKNGCADTTCQDILVFEQPELILPNVFTPGSDGSNDMFFFPNKAVIEFEAVIVNRWGVTMFEFDDITQGWDGTDKSGSPCPDGVYFYKYKATATNGTEFEGQGNIHLIRQE